MLASSASVKGVQQIKLSTSCVIRSAELILGEVTVVPVPFIAHRSHVIGLSCQQCFDMYAVDSIT